MRRKGCAMDGCGSVFVEKRVWKYSVRTLCRSSSRSVKNGITSLALSRPLSTWVRVDTERG